MATSRPASVGCCYPPREPTVPAEPRTPDRSRNPTRPGNPAQRAALGRDLDSARLTARVLDDLFTIPGTNIGIGLDALLGLVPGFGDAAGAALSSIIMVQAVQHGVPLPVMARMGVNVAIDAAIGIVPMVGDIGDVAYRANRKNLRLLEAAVLDPDFERESSVRYLLGAGLIVLGSIAVLIGAGALALWLLSRLFS
ncbi:MAG: hypothetical protein CSB46_06885 [Micrococcales bacterium]|nr:MAG: hypothetical protein CSB46_06885 [Micrococcales bacterium]